MSPRTRSIGIGPGKPALEAIGQVVVNASLADEILRVLVWDYAGVSEPVGQCFTQSERMGVADVLRLLECVVGETRKAKLIEDIRDIAAKARTLFKKRNEFAHQTWGVGATGPVLSKLEKFGTRTHKSYTVKEIRAVADEFEVLLIRLIPHTLSKNTREQFPELSRDFPAPWLTT